MELLLSGTFVGLDINLAGSASLCLGRIAYIIAFAMMPVALIARHATQDVAEPIMAHHTLSGLRILTSLNPEALVQHSLQHSASHGLTLAISRRVQAQMAVL